MILDVDHAESGPEEHLKQVSTLLLAGERVRIGVDVLDRLGIRNHEVFYLINCVINDDESRLEAMHPKQAINFEHLPILLLPSDVGFPGLLEVDFREVSEEWVALPRTLNI